MAWPTGAVLVLGGDGEYGVCPLVAQVLLPTNCTVTAPGGVESPQAVSTTAASRRRTARRRCIVRHSSRGSILQRPAWPRGVRCVDAAERPHRWDRDRQVDGGGDARRAWRRHRRR